MMPRKPVSSYSTTQRDPVTGQPTGSDVEVVICDDGTCWTLIENPKGTRLDWSQDAVPPIPGSAAAAGAQAAKAG